MIFPVSQVHETDEIDKLNASNLKVVPFIDLFYI